MLQAHALLPRVGASGGRAGRDRLVSPCDTAQTPCTAPAPSRQAQRRRRQRGGGGAAAAAGSAARQQQPGVGPPPPPPRPGARSAKPEWVRILEEDAAVDDEVAELLRGTNGDPEAIRARMKAKLDSPYGSAPGAPPSSGGGAGAAGGGAPGAPPGLQFGARTGSDTPPHITFREVDPFDLWMWLELDVPPSARERELLAAVVRSWFVVGKLGGYNAQNLQVYYNNSDDNSYLEYSSAEASGALAALMHDTSEVEFRGSWARFHVDLGTADELALDVLLNMLAGFSAEVAGISRIMVGGEHERWALPAAEDDSLGPDGPDGRAARQHGEAPRVGIDPMRLPQGLEDELELLDELGDLWNEQQQGGQQPQQQQQPQQPQPQQQREWGRGLRPLSGSLDGPLSRARAGAAAGSQQRGARGGAAGGSQPPPPPQAPSQAERVAAAAQMLRQRQAAAAAAAAAAGDVPAGMTMYSEEGFRKAFNVREEEDDDEEQQAGGPSR